MIEREYEFTPEQNTAIQPLAERMGIVGLILIALGTVLAVFGAFTVNIPGVIEGVLMIVIGVWTRKAADAFRQIVATEGNDIPNLMAALHELYKLYTLQFWIFVIAGVLIVIGIVLTLTGVVTMEPVEPGGLAQ